MSRWFVGAIVVGVAVFGAAQLSGTRVSAEPAPVPADVNEDGVVTYWDAFAVAAGLGGENGDVNGDGSVDRRDIAAVLTTMGFDIGRQETRALPTPRPAVTATPTSSDGFGTPSASPTPTAADSA